jgi:uncharacterized membrane protein
MSRSLKEKAKLLMRGKMGILILIALIPGLIFSTLSPTGIGFLLVLPLSIGMAAAFIRVGHGGPGEIKDLFMSLEGSNYLNHLWTLIQQFIFLFLWTLLFFIPGLIKSYSYAQVSHILADDPSEKDAITRSRMMMKGHKLELFFLQLSFLGWLILSGLSFGILWILYVGPYYSQTMALYYLALKERQ